MAIARVARRRLLAAALVLAALLAASSCPPAGSSAAQFRAPDSRPITGAPGFNASPRRRRCPPGTRLAAARPDWRVDTTRGRFYWWSIQISATARIPT